jgi:hypothetical protein
MLLLPNIVAETHLNFLECPPTRRDRAGYRAFRRLALEVRQNAAKSGGKNGNCAEWPPSRPHDSHSNGR